MQLYSDGCSRRPSHKPAKHSVLQPQMPNWFQPIHWLRTPGHRDGEAKGNGWFLIKWKISSGSICQLCADVRGAASVTEWYVTLGCLGNNGSTMLGSCRQINYTSYRRWSISPISPLIARLLRGFPSRRGIPTTSSLVGAISCHLIGWSQLLAVTTFVILFAFSSLDLLWFISGKKAF